MQKVKRIKPMRMLSLVMTVVVVLFLPACGTEKVNTEILMNTLEEASELTTAKLHYTGKTKYEDDGIKYINKGNYTMLYEATARIGIDVKKVKIACDEEEKIVYVKIPKAEVQDVKVDAKSIRYFDESFAILNFDKKEDANKGIVLAEKEAAKEIERMGGLDMANKQATLLVKGILANAIPEGYTVEVKK